MNSDQIKGSVKEMAGKAQRKLGEATGNTEQQLKGAATQVEGKVQKAVGDAREAFKDARTSSRKP
ncbi:CsbD family protein [Roseateles sp.]|uniref:CsbD family protein n=1 Tax=Roseateles sp. TaxID=1971397 RepID=UPI0039EB957E